MIFGRASTFLAACLLLLAAPAAAQTELLPGYPDRVPVGPLAAKGAVIYSPGLARASESLGGTPFALDALQASGWDIFRLQRAATDDLIELWVSAVREAAQRLRSEGYGKIVLAGQSFGGWISLAAADGAVPVYAVIAFAPAAFGTPRDSPDWTMNASHLYGLAGRLAAGRALVFLFDGDDFDPGGRGEALRRIIDQRGLTAGIVDRPFGLEGHAVALTSAFARRFAACIRDYIETVSPAPRFVCGGEAVASSLKDFALPPELPAPRPPADAVPLLAAMQGRWYGAYPIGREVLLVIGEAERTQASAVYAFGPLAREIDPETGYSLRRGVFNTQTGVLAFSEPQIASTIDCRLGSDGRLELVWTSRQTGIQRIARLRKLD
jgi:dienelactone hydrolase